jgi:glycosyltransferase involved in cell wall biosynthesis
MALVSVIIPTHNRKALLLRAVHCVIGQRDVDVELIVVDDGSSDGSAEAVRERFGSRVTLVRHEEPTGVSTARNDGIMRASGEWIAFLDDDDVWAPDKLTSQMAELERSGRLWVYSGMVATDVDLNILHGVRPDPPEVIADEILVRNRLPSGPSNVVVRRTALDEVGLFDRSLRYNADWDMWIRIARMGPPALVPRPLLAHVVHGSNMPTEWMLAEVRTLERRYASLRDGRRIDRGAVYRWDAWARLVAGHRWAAVRSYARALLASPLASTRLALSGLTSSAIGRSTVYRRPPDADWRAQAEAWLRPLRAELVDASC